MFSHWSRPKPNASKGGWVIYSDLQEILLITPGVLIVVIVSAINIVIAVAIVFDIVIIIIIITICT